ncbi:MAG: prepilin-type N-terminal cleavage/methylation domain-containing protein [Phycisphaerales bacterium]|nr:prepilin-type N-terminal cleavage/methylation domain-containing protein [Phycisphaerales bacterium]
MRLRTGNSQFRRGFTLIELVAVIIVLAILAGVAVPKYFDYSTKAKESAAKATLGATRSAIANFYASAALNDGTGAYPTLTELEAAGSVIEQEVPENPYNGSTDVQAATWDATNPPVSGTAGWNYDAATGRFWANSDSSGVDENEW